MDLSAAGSAAAAHTRNGARAANGRRAEDIRAVGDPDGALDRYGVIREKRRRAHVPSQRDEDHDAAAHHGAARQRPARHERHRDRQRPRQLYGRQPDLAQGGRTDERGRDAQVHCRQLRQRLRRRHGRAHLRFRGGVHQAHERPRKRAGHGQYAVSQLHGSDRRPRPLHDGARHCVHVPRTAGPSAHPRVYHHLDGHRARRPLWSRQHQQAHPRLPRRDRPENRLHPAGHALPVGQRRA